MAERNVAVKLTANTAQYEASMKRAATASRLPGEELSKMSRVGGQLQSVGGSMTRYVTVPLAAVGVAATKMAMDFEGSFANMVGLAGAPIGEIDALRESVLSLAGDTGQAPMELADALYAAMSSGLDAAAAMDAVDIAAHGAAAGLGSSADIVSLVASATTSYASSNLDAATAVDILTATIREGRADPDELAGSLGRILPVASELGVSFDDVGAATAYLSNVFGDTNRTVTAMSGLMLKLLSPTKAGRDALEDYGLTVEGLHAAIDEDGLLGALELLRTSGLAGNSQALRAVFDDVEAFQGATALLGADVNVLNEIFENVENSTGAMGEAFAVVAETDGFKMKQALAEIQVAMIKVGDVLLPIAAQIGSAIADLAGWFNELPGPVQKVVVAIGGLVAAGGPALMLAGSLMRNWQTLSTTLSKSGGSFSSAGKALGLLGVAATLGFGAYQLFTAGQRQTDENTRKATDALNNQFPALMGAALAAGEAAGEIDAVAIANDALSLSLSEGNSRLRDAMADLNLSADQTLDVLVMLSDGLDPMDLDNMARSFGLTAEQADLFATTLMNMGFGNVTPEMIEMAEAAGISREQFITLRNAVLDLNLASNTSEAQDVARDYLDLQVATSGYEDSLVAAAEAQAGFTRQNGDAVEVYRIWAELVANATPEQLEAAGMTERMAEAMATMTPEALAAAAGVELVGDAAGDAKGDIGEMDHVLEGISKKLDDAAAAGDRFRGAVERLLGPGDDLREATRAVWEETENFIAALDENGTSFHANTEEGRANQEQMEALRDAWYEHGITMLANGATMEEATADILANAEGLREQAIEAGLTDEEYTHLLQTYGLTPELIETALMLYGEEVANATIDRYNAMLDDIPDEAETSIQAAIDQGAYDLANAMMDYFENHVWHAQVMAYLGNAGAIRQGIVNAVSGINARVGVTAGIRSAAGRYVPGGSNIVSSLGELGGRRGDEVVLPLGDRAGMAKFLAMPEVGPRVWSAMASMYGGMGGGTSTQTTNYETSISVTTPDQAQVATAVRRQVETALFRATAGTAGRR